VNDGERYRDGTLAEYVAIEARNVAPLPGDVDFTVGASLPISDLGGDIQKRSAGLIRAGGTLVSIVGPTEDRLADGLAVDFVVESDRAQLSEIVQRVRDGRLRTNIGTVATLDVPSPLSIRPSGSAGRRSSAFVPEGSGTASGSATPSGSSSPLDRGNRRSLYNLADLACHWRRPRNHPGIRAKVVEIAIPHVYGKHAQREFLISSAASDPEVPWAAETRARPDSA
jgi:hypothetical protein